MALFWISNQKLMKFDYQGRVVIRAWSEKIKLAVVCRIKWTGRNRTRHPVKKKKLLQSFGKDVMRTLG